MSETPDQPLGDDELQTTPGADGDSGSTGDADGTDGGSA